MFSLQSPGLGTLLSSPSADSITFKTDKVNGIARLYTEHVPPSDHRFWSSILCHFHSPSHTFDTFSIKDARSIRDRQPANLRTLLELLTLHLDSLKYDEHFASPEGVRQSSQGLTDLGRWVASPLTSAFAPGPSSSSTSPRDRTKEALNCARLLTRLLPVLYEDPGGHSGSAASQTWTSSLEEEILWTRREAAVNAADDNSQVAVGTADDDSANQFVIQGDDDDDEASRVSSPENVRKDPLSQAASASSEAADQSTSQRSDQAQQTQRCLAESLLHLVVDFLFFPGFTLPADLHSDEDDGGTPDGSRVHFAIWQKGVGSSVDLRGTTKQHVAHRTEFLRLFLVLVSKSMYVPPPAQVTFRDRATEYVCTSFSRTVTLPLLCSLLNTACAGGGHGGMEAGAAATGQSWNFSGPSQTENEGSRDVLRAVSFQLLVALLEWEPISSAEEATSESPASRPPQRPAASRTVSQSSTISSTPSTPNQFAFWLSKLHRSADLDLLSSSLFHTLRPPPNSLMSSLPIPSAPGSASSSQGIYPQSPEAMTLLWRLLRSNNRFRAFVLDDAGRAAALLGTLLSHALLGKDSPSSHGIVRLALFVLQDVSAHEAFARSICKVGSAHAIKLPSKFSNAMTNGMSTAADVLIAASYALLTTRGMGSSGLSIYPVILIALANCAPYFTSLTIGSSNRLCLLLTQFANPSFLLADEGHPRCLYFLLETINGVLVHQAQTNVNLVYAVLTKDRELERLRKFSLRWALAEIRRRQGLFSPPSATATRTSAAPDDSAAATSGSSAEEEKARLAAKDEQTAAASASPDQEPIGAPAVRSEKALGKARQMSISASDQAQLDVAVSTAHEQERKDSALSQSKAADDGHSEGTALDAWVSNLDDGELYQAASTLGRNGFVPMEAWVTSWASNLPLGPLIKLHDSLREEMETLCSSETIVGKGDADQRVLAWLREQDLKGLFDTSATEGQSSITSRPFRWTEQVTIWLASFTWGAAYVHHLPYSIWPMEGMRLFYLVQPQQQLKSQTAAGAALGGIGSWVGALGGVFGAGSPRPLQSPSSGGDEGGAQGDKRADAGVV